jgi:predicted DNA-binding transcriptional regulator AlpA
MRHLAKPMVNITQLAKETGVSRRTIYDKKSKLGRLPTKEELMGK